MSKENLPNALIIGVQKGGTSSLFNWLAQHPDVYGPPAAKDFPFFSDDDFFSRGLDFYSSFFPNANGSNIVLAGDVHLIYYTDTAKRLKSFNPDLKLILALRNPVDRAFSAYQFNRKRGLENQSFRHAINIEIKPESHGRGREFNYIDHGFYDRQIKEYQDEFSDAHLKIVLFEDLINHKEKTIKDIYSFLDVDSGFMPDFKVVNETGVSAIPILNQWMFSDFWLKRKLKKNRLFNKMLPMDTRIRIRRNILYLNTIRKRKEILTTETKDELNEIYRESIMNLQGMIKRDLTDWMN